MDEAPYECAIVGGGVAGLSAALVLGRARRRTIVVDEGHPRNETVVHAHGLLTRDGIAPNELLEIARRDVERYPDVRFLRGRVEAVQSVESLFRVDVSGAAFIEARRLLLAIGVRDERPPIDGLEALWGKSVFTCPFCDGYEYRDRPIAVLGCANDAVHLAQELYRWSRDIVVLCPEGAATLPEAERAWLDAAGVTMRHEPVRALNGGEGRLHTIEFTDGSGLERDALFLCAALQPAFDLPQRLGCELDAENRIVVDDCHKTSVPHCYAAGDVVTRRHQLSTAIASGAQAAISVNDDLVEEEVRAMVRRR
ncbi:MAG: NAD(P)/FAD-dependent oxidoreductase [Candidatus Eremiobacteraeota bacterium]|nr:NAD(P)/FAD-dependent oxidoreductase [Candidatus Eremiobacteraeota bacterium]